jgi:hypothetical protein
MRYECVGTWEYNKGHKTGHFVPAGSGLDYRSSTLKLDSPDGKHFICGAEYEITVQLVAPENPASQS